MLVEIEWIIIKCKNECIIYGGFAQLSGVLAIIAAKAAPMPLPSRVI